MSCVGGWERGFDFIEMDGGMEGGRRRGGERGKGRGKSERRKRIWVK